MSKTNVITITSVKVATNGSGEISLRNGTKSAHLQFKKAPSDVHLLRGQVIEISPRSIYLNDEMIAWIESKDQIDFMVNSIKEVLDEDKRTPKDAKPIAYDANGLPVNR